MLSIAGTPIPLWFICPGQEAKPAWYETSANALKVQIPYERGGGFGYCPAVYLISPIVSIMDIPVFIIYLPGTITQTTEGWNQCTQTNKVYCEVSLRFWVFPAV